MPIDEKDIDEIIQPPTKLVLDKMEKGKFYSLDEMSQMIIGQTILDRESLKQFLGDDYKGKRFVPTEEVLGAIVGYLMNVAYVESVLVSLLASGGIERGLKDKMPYFRKK